MSPHQYLKPVNKLLTADQAGLPANVNQAVTSTLEQDKACPSKDDKKSYLTPTTTTSLQEIPNCPGASLRMWPTTPHYRTVTALGLFALLSSYPHVAVSHHREAILSRQYTSGTMAWLAIFSSTLCCQTSHAEYTISSQAQLAQNAITKYTIGLWNANIKLRN